MMDDKKQTEENTRKKKPTPAPTEVKVISVQGESALVEWLDGEGLHRVHVPLRLVAADGHVSARTLGRGIPYGVEWEQVEVAPVEAGALAQALREAGIWTQQDLSRNQRMVLGILQSLYRVDLASLNRLAKEASK